MRTITQNQSSAALLITTATLLLFVMGLSALAQSNKSMGKGSEHRSAIANLATELNKIADRESGIGEELREIAKAQNDSKEKVAEAVDKVDNRSGLKTFFLGTDYKNLGVLRSAMVTTDNHISRLMTAKERATDSAIMADLDEQITVLQAEKASIETFIKENEDRFNVFGWFVKLFNK